MTPFSLAWLTDIHLNFLESQSRQEFYHTLVGCDAVVITGDIAEAPSLQELLLEMQTALRVPIYFVLGNHDYYHGSVAQVRQAMKRWTLQHQHLVWLPSAESVQLTDGVYLLGTDGWADGRYGDYSNSWVELNDSRLILELRQAKMLGKYPLLDAMQALADQDAKQLDSQLHALCKNQQPQKVIVACHVPPFEETCMHQGQVSNADFLPFFASQATGDVLLSAASAYPDCQFQVLCGHTHSSAKVQVRDNLLVQAGSAVYSKPSVQLVLEL